MFFFFENVIFWPRRWDLKNGTNRNQRRRTQGCYALQGLFVDSRLDEAMGVFQNFQKFRARVWKRYGTHRSSGIVARAYKTHRSSKRVQNMLLYPYPGYCGTGGKELTAAPGTGTKLFQNFPRSSGCGYESLTELPEVPGMLWHGRSELSEVPDRYEIAVPVLRVFVAVGHGTYRSSRYGHECPP